MQFSGLKLDQKLQYRTVKMVSSQLFARTVDSTWRNSAVIEWKELCSDYRWDAMLEMGYY
jgi:hypothetical protein